MMAIEESKDSRIDMKAARKDALASDRAALELRKRSDHEAKAKETRQAIFAVISSVVSVAGGAVGLGAVDAVGQAKSTMESIQKGLEIAGHAVGGAGAMVDLVVGDNTRALQREADEVALKTKEAESRISDAEAARKEALTARDRSLDAALEIQRNMTPVFA
ncbi:MAG: hypothetical protein H6729_08000 [Deltaproteobacteria bacterium]|nr:hypothetical protein [Deltaproteobacteria bacterium]